MPKRILTFDEKMEIVTGAFAVALWVGGWTAIIVGASHINAFAAWLALGISLLITAAFILRGLD